jgi:hypothetical protein
MSNTEVFKYGGAGILILLLTYANKYKLFSSAAARADAWEFILTWLHTYQVWIILVIVFFTVIPIFKAWGKRRQRNAIAERVKTGPTVLLLPRSDWRPVDPAKINLWARLADALPHDEPISFEIGGSGTDLFFALHGSDEGVRAALTQFKSEWPGVQRRPVETDHASVPSDWHVFWVELRPHSWREPINALSNDPLRSVLVEVNGVIGRGRGLVQVIAQNDYGTRAKLGNAAFNARAEKVQNAGVRAIRTREARGLEERAQRAFLQTTIRCVGIADSESRAEGIARGLARAVSASYGHSNPVKPVRSGKDPLPVLERRMGKSQAWADDELSTLAHLTGSDMLFVAPRLKTASAKSLPPDPEMRVTSIDITARFTEELA